MVYRWMSVPVLLWFAACSSDASAPGSFSDATVFEDAEVTADATELDLGVAEDAGFADLGPPDTGIDALTSRLVGYLMGDFDNRAQVDRGFPQFVERHVCPMPGLEPRPGVTWLYVEHLESVAQGRDAYFIRVNELSRVGDTVVSKAYRFAVGHPLRTNAFAFNGPRDACFGRTPFGDVTVDELEYRAGCDVTFVPEGDRFSATSPEMTCTFPGGWIQTLSTVWADGLDSRDRAVTPQGESGSTFEFRRVFDFMPPGG